MVRLALALYCALPRTMIALRHAQEAHEDLPQTAPPGKDATMYDILSPCSAQVFLRCSAQPFSFSMV